MFCPTCGAEVNDNAVICVKCGCKLKDDKPKKFDEIVYILLGVFLGAFGAHNFYIGKNGRALVQLLLTLLSFGILSFFVQIWAIVEVCMNAKKING